MSKDNKINEDGAGSDISARAEKIKAIRAAINAEEDKSNTTDTVPPKSDKSAKSKPNSSAKKEKKKKKKKKKKTLRQSLRDLFPKKGDSVLEIIRKIVFLAAVIAIIVCGYMVGDYYLDLWRSRLKYNEIADIYDTYDPGEASANSSENSEFSPYEKYYTMLTAAKKLMDINEDVIGYMRILTKNGDPIIELPVVQSEDNNKYLHLNFNGDDSRSGALFLDWRNNFDRVKDHYLVAKNSDNLVVYGHNMADESMFGKLKYYQTDEKYYENHSIIQFNSNYETYSYKIFSIFIVDAFDESETKYDCWNHLDFNSEEEYYDFVNEAKRRTLRTNDVDVKYGDQILTLSTCNYLLGDRSRLIIMARKVRSGEDLYAGTTKSKANKNIKWPSMYYVSKPNEKYDEDAIFIPYGPEEAVKEAEEAAAAEKKAKDDKNKENKDKKKEN